MGLTDILTGMLNGPRGGSRQDGDRGSGSGGMSPITMALLALLAYKAIKGFGGSSSTQAAPPPAGGALPAGLGLDEILKGAPGGGQPQAQGGGLGGLLAGLGAGGLGGLLASLGGAGQTGAGQTGGGQPGGGLGGVLGGGLSDLLDQFRGAGRGEAANSWIGPGENHPIAPHELSQVLTSDQIDFLTQHTGLPRDELLTGLSEQLPQLVDKLTPDGRLPTADEIDRA
jgi:uncharacterized protein YidB (DUF937 family)